jgi:nitrite reductase (NO-forming)
LQPGRQVVHLTAEMVVNSTKNYSMFRPIVFSVIIAGLFLISSSFLQKFDLAKSVQRGKEVYMGNCISCHMVDGAGSDIYPPVAKTDYLKKPAKELINIILQGQSGEITVNKKKYDILMPAQPYLSDEQVSDVLNYIRNSMGNKYTTPITPAQVKALR